MSCFLSIWQGQRTELPAAWDKLLTFHRSTPDMISFFFFFFSQIETLTDYWDVSSLFLCVKGKSPFAECILHDFFFFKETFFHGLYRRAFILYRTGKKIGFKIVQIIWEWLFHCWYSDTSVIGPLEKPKIVRLSCRQDSNNTSIVIFQHGLKRLMLLKELKFCIFAGKLLPRRLFRLCTTVPIGKHVKEPLFLSLLGQRQ